MKIVILVHGYPPAKLGGTEIAASNIAYFLKERGHQIYVIAASDVGYPRKRKENKINIIRIPYRNIKFLGIGMYWIQTSIAIFKISPDIVHVQSTTSGMPAFWNYLLSRKPYVVWPQGSDIYFSTYINDLFLKFLLINAKTVIALTKHMKQCLVKKGAKKILIIPNGIIIQPYKRTKLFDVNHIILVYSGSLRPVKGVKYLIIAMKELKKIYPNIQLFIIGDGICRNYLESLSKSLDLQSSVNFVGRIEQKHVFNYLRSGDIFILPSLSEGFPLVILEAMTVGLPILATNIRGVPEIVENGVNGFLVEPKNSDEIVEKIKNLVDNPSLMISMSNQNIVKADNYSWDKIIIKLENVYFESLGKNNSSS